MYNPIENGTLFTFAGIDCWVPPTPKKSEILFSNLKTKDQKWRREPLPDYYKELRPEEKRIQQEEWKLVQNGELDKIYHFNPILEKYRRQQWKMRMNGVHIMINGEVVYLTGAWWFYLQWCKFDHKENGGYPTFYMSQRKRFYFRQSCFEDNHSLGYLIIGPRGGGKCLSPDTMVRMYSGEAKMVKNISNGELVIGEDGTPRTVSGVATGREEMFRITPNKGEPFSCNKSHILSLYFNGINRYVPMNWEKQSYVNISVEQYLKLPFWVKDHLTIYRRGWGIHYKELDNPGIPSYLLGLYLGDGTQSCGDISNPDEEVREYIADYAKSIGYDVKSRGKNNLTMSINLGQRGSTTNIYVQGLRDIDVINNKHIPDNYLRSSKDDRFELLAGLIDTDGYLDKVKGNVFEIIQKDKILSYQIVELARSLDLYVSIKEKMATLKREGKPTYKCIVYRIIISGDTINIPTKIARKKATVRRQIKNHRHSGFKVESLGVGDYCGFEVDKDHLFLLEDGTVTHNTTEETAMILESMTRGPKRRSAALQSKSQEDAKSVIFKGKFAPAFKSLPDFFQPNNNHGTNPENKLSFFLDSKRGERAKKQDNLEDFELENLIFHVPAKEKALDGQTLSEILSDEIGKVDPKREANAYDRQNINRFCVFRNQRKVGMIRATTTVEEMDKGGDECKKVWNESNQNVRNDNGYTVSGLYRLFTSIIEMSTQFADEYGIVDEEKAMEYQMNERDSIKHDSRAISSWMRKNPIYEEEAFIKDASKSVFNVFVLTQRLQELNSMKRMPYLRGNFYWVDKVDGLVDFKEDNHAGRFLVAKILDAKTKSGEGKPGQQLANQMSYFVDTEGKKQWKPKNNKYFRMATDPIKYSKTKDPRASKMAIHGFELYNASEDNSREMKDWRTHNYMFEYIYRPEDPEVAYEDVIMAMRYYGCSVLPETNIKELAKHLNDRGYNECVIYRRDFDYDFIGGQQDDAGVASNQEVIHSYVTRLITFINRHGHRIKFPRTIEALLEFEPDNTTMYDAVVSAGYALFAAEAPLDLEVELEDIGGWFDEFDNSGAKSTILDAF